MFRSVIEEDLIFPYNGMMMRTKVLLEQGMITYSTDWSGYESLTQSEQTEEFYQARIQEKTYYPVTNYKYEEGVPVEIIFELSKSTNNLGQSVYNLTNLLIEIGGISRAFFSFGLILAHFAALHLYRASLIEDLFMVQDESATPHPSYTNHIKKTKKQFKEGGEKETNALSLS